MNFFEVFLKLTFPHGVFDHLFHVEFIFFVVGETGEGLLFVVDFLLEFSFEPFVDLIAEETLLSAVVIDEVGLESPDKAYFSDLFLSLHALSNLVFFGEIGRYFGGFILIIFNQFDIFLLLDFHQGRRTGFEGHFVLFFVVLLFLQRDFLILHFFF